MSIDAPLGKALFGSKVGDIKTYKVNNANLEIEIKGIDIEYNNEKQVE
ncbi:MAG TPA: hypothetical protein DEP72_06480 [Clostridiales bacterium]|nr:hypothetical protein [Clostridiales bacterium]